MPKPVFKYDTGSRTYWTMDANGVWICINESSLKLHLQVHKFSPIPGKNQLVSPLEREIVRIQMEENISFAGALAGYQKGIHEVCGNRILVTSSHQLIPPAPGEFPLLNHILEGMFYDPIHDQRPYIFGWLKTSIESLRASTLRPAQVLAIAGPADSFKSSLQNLITLMLGGRVAKPYRYMSGSTTFNKDLFAAEHLMIEDEVALNTIKNRLHFAARIKDFTVNETQSCHGKGREALTLRPFWRVTISLNDQPEALLILPPIDEGLADKIILLKAKPFDLPSSTSNLADRTVFWNALVSELPAFLLFLQEWKIPPELVSNRFGVTHYHHPDLLRAIDVLAPEMELLNMIDGILFAPGAMRSSEWRGSAADLQRALVDSSMRHEATRLFHWSSACGTYLGRLASKMPHRVQENRTSEARRWLIHRRSE